MPLEIKLELVPTTSIRQIQEAPMGRLYEVIDYWDSQPKLQARLQVGGREHVVNYVFAPPSWINHIARGEKYGVYVGDMMFINSQLQVRNPDYVPYVLLKLHGEKHVDSGADISGRVKHWQSLWATIRVAGQLMDPSRLHSFLSELEQHERSGYFELDAEVRKFMEEHNGELLAGKRKYLEAHHGNRWVTMGRTEEVLASLGIHNDGYRNHAEAIMSAVSDLDLRELYLMTGFVRALSSVEPNEPIQINRPYTSFAHALTKDGNGLVDLVKFRNSPQVKVGQDDIMFKLPGKFSTWAALSKRLSYQMHKAEEDVRELAEGARGKLDRIIIQAGQRAADFDREVQLIRRLTAGSSENQFAEARRRLQGLPAYRNQVTQLEQVSASVAGTIQQLEELSEVLEGQI